MGLEGQVKFKRKRRVESSFQTKHEYSNIHAMGCDAKRRKNIVCSHEGTESRPVRSSYRERIPFRERKIWGGYADKKVSVYFRASQPLGMGSADNVI